MLLMSTYEGRMTGYVGERRDSIQSCLCDKENDSSDKQC